MFKNGFEKSNRKSYKTKLYVTFKCFLTRELTRSSPGNAQTLPVKAQKSGKIFKTLRSRIKLSIMYNKQSNSDSVFPRIAVFNWQ